MKKETAVRILLIGGLAISSYLLWLRLSGQTSSLVGCGTGSGCSDVLGSRWSQVFGIPVSALSVITYLTLLLLEKRPIRVTGGWLLIFAALWFIGLQLIAVQSLCPWCMAAHVIGLVAGALLVWRSQTVVPPALAALFASVALAAAQLLGPVPETHAVTHSYIGGNLTIAPAELPHLGDPAAEHVLVEYFDYTCDTCLELHEDLKILRESAGGSVAIVCMPTPLERACNPKLRPGFVELKNACALSKLSLAAWRSDPESWPKVHDLLFTRPVLEPGVAQVEIEKIVGKLDLADPWIDQHLRQNGESLYALSSEKAVMPKLLLGGTAVMHGLAKDTETFVTLISERLKL